MARDQGAYGGPASRQMALDSGYMASSGSSALVRLVCPRCRRVDDQGRLLVSGLRDPSTDREAWLGSLGGSQVLECASATCRARYPVVSGVPVVFRSPDSCALEQAAWFGPSCPGVETLLAAVTRRDPASALAADVAQVGRWAQAGFGDWADDGRTCHVRDVLAWLRELGHPMEGLLASFGCAIGREAWEWQDSVVLVDSHLPSLLAARTLEAEGRLSAWLPDGGNDWRRLDIVAPSAPRAPVALVCADVLDPPFEARSFPNVLATNLLDSVSDPWLALQQLAAATRDGGWLTVTSPFAWRADITPRERWFSSFLPMTDQQALSTLAAELNLRQVAERELSWEVSVSGRQSVVYRSACSAFRK
jgi:hypothetical protein